MSEQFPRRIFSYESEHARRKNERAKQWPKPADLIALMALENSGESIVQHQLESDETDHGSRADRLIELLKRCRGLKIIESYQDEGWY